MNFTNKEIKEEYLRRAKISFETAKSKIEECLKDNQDLGANKSQLRENVHFCADKEINEFRITWFRSFPEELFPYKEYIECAIETQKMYIELISMVDKLSIGL